MLIYFNSATNHRKSKKIPQVLSNLVNELYFAIKKDQIYEQFGLFRIYAGLIKINNTHPDESKVIFYQSPFQSLVNKKHHLQTGN